MVFDVIACSARLIVGLLLSMKDATLFWEWFSDHQEQFKYLYRLDPDQQQSLMDELTDMLHGFSPGLFAETGDLRSSYELIITAQGIKAYFADALALVYQAPPLPDWQFYALKPPLGFDFTLRSGAISLDCDDIWFEPFETRDPDDIGIRVLHADYQESDQALQHTLINGLYYCLDMMLGERAVSLDINYIRFERLPGIRPDTMLPLRELAAYIKWRIGERSNYLVLFPPMQLTLLEGQKEEHPFLITVNRGYKNYSFCTDFPWMSRVTISYKQLGPGGQPRDKMDALYRLEATLLRRLGGKGHHVATESFKGKRIFYYYTDTTETAAQLLHIPVSETEGYEPDVTLSYDPFWIGVLPFM